MAKMGMKAPKGMKKLKTDDKSSSLEYKYDPRPSIEFTSDELPEVADWKPGTEYTLIVQVKQERLTVKTDDKGKQKQCASFKVVSVKAYDEGEEEEEESEPSDDAKEEKVEKKAEKKK